MLEKDLYPYIKKYFNDFGYKVYPEIRYGDSQVDLVAVKGIEQIAVELKTSFNNYVIRQATRNINAFGKSYIAFPVNKLKCFEFENENLTKFDWDKYWLCVESGIGILEVLPHGTVCEVLIGDFFPHRYLYDFTGYKFDENEIGGVKTTGPRKPYLPMYRVRT